MRKRDRQKPKRISELIVVGGGASGLMACIAASRSGIRPVLLERMDRVGRKILATGNGRCNLTNLNTGLAWFHGTNPGFASAVLQRFGVPETLRFFESLGLAWKAEDGGRVFPCTDQASAVLDLLRYELRKNQVEECCGSDVVAVEPSDDEFRLELKNSHILFAKNLVLAAGGRAAPALGSNGSGYHLAQMLGHSIIEPFPTIVQIRLKSPILKRLKGVRVNGRLALRCVGAEVMESNGEILFTEYGISGPPSMKLSRRINECLRASLKPEIEIDQFPETTGPDFRILLEQRTRLLFYKDSLDGLVGLVHKRLAPVVLEQAMIDQHKAFGRLSVHELDRLASVLKSWRFEVIGTRSWLDAQASAGGVSTAEIDPETLESRIVPGLYLAGEILDIDGDSGGFNLQWAWSSGWVAGTNAAVRAAHFARLKTEGR
jgi:predicted Rossmann fold flavoprotein